MKKIIFIVLSIMILALVTACGCSTDANVEGDMGDTANGQVTENGRSGSNEGVIGGSASADFDIGMDDDVNDNNNGYDANNGRNNTNDGNTARSNTSSNGEGELSKLASLVGADDFKVIETLGEGNPDTVIDGNIAIVKRRTYKLPVFGNKENVILSYGKEGLVENIEISPAYAPTLWSINISGEYGIAEKVSSDGLDYDFYSMWRKDSKKIELICWNNKMSVQIAEV